jgi:cell division protein FtsB
VRQSDDDYKDTKRRGIVRRRLVSGVKGLPKPAQERESGTNLIPLRAGLRLGLDATGGSISTESMVVSPPTSGSAGRFASLRASYARLSLGRRKVATLAAAALALGVGYHVVFGANGLTVYEQKRHETHALKQEMLDLQRENDQLQGRVDRLQSDPNAIEHQAREELHYTRPGEVIYVLPTK